MKKLIAPILICTVLLTACHNNLDGPAENVEETIAETTTTIETTVEPTIETTAETIVEETEEIVETNLNGAMEISVPEELTNGYWTYIDEGEQITWQFNRVSSDINSTGHNADLEKRDMYTYEIIVDQDFDYFVYDDNTIYAYLISRGTRTGDCFIYSYSLDGDTLVMTKIGELGPDGTYYENARPDLYTWTFTRQFEADVEY